MVKSNKNNNTNKIHCEFKNHTIRYDINVIEDDLI